MTPLKLDKYIRCVKLAGNEEWFAYSIVAAAWFPLPAKEAEWILSMLQGIDVDTVMAHCRANCYSGVACDAEGVLFEK